MKLLLFLLVAISHAAIAGYVEFDIKELENEINKIQRSHRESVAEERELSSRIQNLAAKAPEFARLQAELNETRQLLGMQTKREKDCQVHLKKLRSSPEHRVVTAIVSDKRHPTKANVSGVWTSGPNLVGYVIQLEQQGTSVRGQGYYWGCTETIDVFDITGVYEDDVLTLTFDVPSRKREKHGFSYDEKRNRPRFRVPGSKWQERIMPKYELHQ